MRLLAQAYRLSFVCVQGIATAHHHHTIFGFISLAPPVKNEKYHFLPQLLLIEALTMSVQQNVHRKHLPDFLKEDKIVKPAHAMVVHILMRYMVTF